jgi:hypothetical protein
MTWGPRRTALLALAIVALLGGGVLLAPQVVFWIWVAACIAWVVIPLVTNRYPWELWL